MRSRSSPELRRAEMEQGNTPYARQAVVHTVQPSVASRTVKDGQQAVHVMAQRAKVPIPGDVSAPRQSCVLRSVISPKRRLMRPAPSEVNKERSMPRCDNTQLHSRNAVDRSPKMKLMEAILARA